MPNKRSAFSLIELLVVIAILLVLIGLLILGTSALMGGSRKEATMVTLSSLQSMLAEYDAKTKLSKSPGAWRWWNTSDAETLKNPPLNYWNLPASYSAPRNPDAMDAPGIVSEGVARHGSRQIFNTQIVMGMLLAMPANRAALSQIASDRQFTPEWTGGRLDSPGIDAVLLTTDDLPKDSAAAERVHYLPGIRVVRNGVRYRCVTEHSQASPVSGTPGGNWTRDESPVVPVLLDAWNNPIIFVPATGLRVRLLNGKTKNDPNDAGQTFIVLSPEGRMGRDTATGYPTVEQVGRPFWASAGPDGNFATGDDNVYSFQQ